MSKYTETPLFPPDTYGRLSETWGAFIKAAYACIPAPGLKGQDGADAAKLRARLTSLIKDGVELVEAMGEVRTSEAPARVAIDPSLVVSVYVGEPGRCCCGCSGTYYYAKAHQLQGSKERGYVVKDSELDDNEIIRVTSILNDPGTILDIDGPGLFSAEVDGELLIARYAGA